MYQEEILKAIKEQTEAIDRQTQAIKKQTQAFEQFAKNFERIFESGTEEEVVKIENLTPEQREENRNPRLQPDHTVMSCQPPIPGLGTEVPGPVRHGETVGNGISQPFRTAPGDDLRHTGIRMDPPEDVIVPLFFQPPDFCRREQVVHADEDAGKAPEIIVNDAVCPENGESADQPHSSLDQFERSVQRQLTRFDRFPGFPIALGICQQVMANGPFVSSQGDDVLHYPPRCILQTGSTGMETEEIGGKPLERGRVDPIAVFAEHHCQGVGCRKGTIQVLGQDAGLIPRHDQSLFLVVPPDDVHVQPNGTQRDQQGDDKGNGNCHTVTRYQPAPSHSGFSCHGLPDPVIFHHVSRN